MIVRDISLKNFRSYSDDVFEFGDGVNIIVGPNASGKTNLLEALLVVATGSSYRVKDSELIQYEQPWTRLLATTDAGERKITIERAGEVSKKKYTIDGKQFKRLTLANTIPVVVFEPEHLRMLHGGPERRRDYLDSLLEQTVTGYGRLRREYRRTLSQRNALLKSMTGSIDTQLFAWNVRLSELGGQIVAARTRLVTGLQNEIQAIYNQIASAAGTVRLEYTTDASAENYSSQVLALLTANIDKDRLRGFTGNGPHRHDLQVILNNHPASVSASRGETRTLLLALKILELSLLERVRGQKPILLLDDVFSELDGARRKALTKFLKPYQAFITTTDADIVVQHFMDNCTILPIKTN